MTNLAKYPAIIAAGAALAIQMSSALAASCPADVSTLAPGTWCSASNSHLRSVAYDWPAGVTYTLNGIGVEGVIDLWNSGAYDTNRDRLMVWGGGHNGYGGNEIYAFDVNQLKWERIIDPSLQLQASGSAYYSDGTPSAQHTYGGLEFVPTIDRFLIFPGNGYWGSIGGGTKVHAFNLDTNTWERKADINGFAYTAAAYDPVSGHVWVKGNAGDCYLAEYDPPQNTWTRRSEFLGCYNYYSTMAIDPVRRKLVAVGEGNIWIWDISQSGYVPQVAKSTSGGGAIINATSPGFTYDPVSDKFVGWNGGGDVYTLDMDTYAWNRITPSAANSTTPTAANETGTYGRFRYIPSKNVFIVVNSVDENVYFYKMTPAGGVSVPNAPGKPTIQVRLQ